MVFLKLLENLHKKTTQILDSQKFEPVQFSVESAKPGFGDITCNVPFLLSKQLKKSPQEISSELSKLYDFADLPEIKNVEAHSSGYLNFAIDYAKFNDNVISSSTRDDYGKIDIGKFKSYEARRTLDRMIGYEISPITRDLGGAFIATGRVQGPALRLVVEREKDRLSFVKSK